MDLVVCSCCLLCLVDGCVLLWFGRSLMCCELRIVCCLVSDSCLFDDCCSLSLFVYFFVCVWCCFLCGVRCSLRVVC